ncbi:MAG: cation transporter, partial [Spirochaetales bacterium]|nr:cation transporter [Spirochaetales bacterium]
MDRNIKVQHRDRTILFFAVGGIVLNLLLFIGKLIVGNAVKSNAIRLDSFNSLADSLSFLLIVVSTRLTRKRADRNHPFGYGRFEYISSLILSTFILYVGGRSAFHAIIAIINPRPSPSHNVHSVLVMSIALATKLVYGILARRKGRKLNSPGLVLSGTDSMGDSLIALSVLVGMAVDTFINMNIEGYLCLAISIMILRTGIEMVRDCMNKILGTKADPDFVMGIKHMIANEEGVLSLSNLIIHDYGEELSIGSVDIEVDSRLKASEIARITSNIKEKALGMGLTLTSVGISATELDSPRADEMWDQIVDISRRHEGITRIHSFSVDFGQNTLHFSVVVDYGAQNPEQI